MEFVISGVFVRKTLVDRLASCFDRIAISILCVGRLGETNGTCGSRSIDIQTEKVLDGAKIAKFELVREGVKKQIEFRIEGS
jgi:hypothetical protein